MGYTIWVSADCNLNCRYCYEGSEKPLLYMNKDMALDVVNYIKGDLKNNKSDKLDINFHGGEPFMNIDIIKYFIKEIKKIGDSNNLTPQFSVTTNGTILNDEILNLIVNDIPMTTVSIDGTKKTHDYMRPYKNGKGSYDVVIKNSKRILSKIKEVRVRMTFDSETVNYLADDVNHLIKLGFKLIVPAANFFDKRWDSFHIEILKKQIMMIKDFISDYDDVHVSLCDPIEYVNRSACKGGVNSKVIYTDGSIYPCLMSGGIEEFKIGNIYTGINKEKVDEILSYSKLDNPNCQGCLMTKACDGNRCKIINKLLTDDYNLPPLMQCELTNLLYSCNGICSEINYKY